MKKKNYFSTRITIKDLRECVQSFWNSIKNYLTNCLQVCVFSSCGARTGTSSLPELGWMLLKLEVINSDVLCSTQMVGVINVRVKCYIKNYLVLSTFIELSTIATPKIWYLKQSICFSY